MTQESPAFEVRCQPCDVSFPVGTRMCIHCGERIGRGGLLRLGPLSDADGELRELGADEMPFEPEVEVEEPPRGRFARIGVTLVWLIVVVLSSIARSCQEG